MKYAVVVMVTQDTLAGESLTLSSEASCAEDVRQITETCAATMESAMVDRGWTPHPGAEDFAAMGMKWDPATQSVVPI